MTASEFGFLALGIVLGVATGFAIAEVLRPRPVGARHVRVTVTPDSIPRRSSTLAASAFVEPQGPAPGGPAAPQAEPAVAAQAAVAESTETSGASPALVNDAPTTTSPAGVPSPSIEAEPVGIEIRPEGRPADAMRDALRAAEARAATVLGHEPRAEAAREQGTESASAGSPAPTAVRATDDRADGDGGGRARAAADATATGGTTARVVVAATAAGNGSTRPDADHVAAPPRAASEPCSDARRTADERCELARAARDRATAAAERLREVQRAYDAHIERADRAAEAADPLRTRATKDAAQRAFRAERDRATTRNELEAAARAWLVEINRINAEVRAGSAASTRERAAAAELVTSLERLAVEADAARIASESADAVCLAARQSLADCEEASGRPGHPEAPVPSVEPSGAAQREPAVTRPPWDEPDDGLAAAGDGPQPMILALLGGDREALARVAADVAGDDEGSRRTWMVEIGRLVEAIVDRAIEASAFQFPAGHPFWGPFTRSQGRDIAGALSSLGFRFDGLGGWADDRIPSQRDLSLAVGYAGLDPMRIRKWPSEDEMAELYRDVRVAAGDYLAEAAAGLTLGELVSLLGRRADGLTEVWNAWGRIRPALLAPSRGREG